MDIILELVDTFIADHIYAFVLPTRPTPYDFSAAHNANTTTQAFSSWTYKPATKLLYVQPYEAAYKSAWPRDNALRQLISLYFIVWYVPE